MVAAFEFRLIGDAIERTTLAAFYEQPAGATDGAPGSIIRSEELIGVPFDARAWRIMYRTLVGETTGNAMLDAVRAAESLTETGASTDVVMWGHSQGGQAALFAAQLAPTYAPELTVKAVATAAPAADLTALMGDHLTDVSGVTIGSYAFTAFSEVDADRGATLVSSLTLRVDSSPAAR